MRKPRTAKAALKAAYAIIKNPKRWTQGTYQKGTGDTAQFCAYGALRFVDGSGQRKAEELLRSACNVLFDGRSIVGVNDGGTRRTAHLRILRAFRRAIRHA